MKGGHQPPSDTEEGMVEGRRGQMCVESSTVLSNDWITCGYEAAEEEPSSASIGSNCCRVAFNCLNSLLAVFFKQTPAQLSALGYLVSPSQSHVFVPYLSAPASIPTSLSPC